MWLIFDGIKDMAESDENCVHIYKIVYMMKKARKKGRKWTSVNAYRC